MSRYVSSSRRPLLGFQSLERRVMLSVSAQEQLAIELINRARANPVAEVQSNPQVASLNAGIPASAHITPTAKAPLAPHRLLQQMADAHTRDMWQRRYYGHDDLRGVGTQERFDASPYRARSGEENVGRETYFHPTQNADPSDPRSFEQAIRQQHQEFFASASHRLALLREAHAEVGIGASEHAGPWNATGTGGLRNPRIPNGVAFMLVTQVFGSRDSSPILTGVAIDDRDADHFYDIGEGLAGVRVTARDNSGRLIAETMTASGGGYALELPAGTYSIQAVGNGVNSQQSVTLHDRNVKRDFRAGVSGPAAPVPTRPIDQSVAVGEQLALNLRFSDINPNDSHTATVHWGDGNSSTVNVAHRAREFATSHRFDTPGAFTARFEITDASGRTGQTSFTIVVADQNVRPTIDEVEVTVRRAGNATRFQFRVNDPNPNETHTAIIQFGDGHSVRLNEPNLADAYGFQTEHTYESPNEYQATIRVTDSAGLSRTVDRSLRVRTPTSWHNVGSPTDVDRVHGTTPIDALLITNELTLRQHSSPSSGLITNPTTSPSVWLDVNNNGAIEPVDALLTVNALVNSSASVPDNVIEFELILDEEDEFTR